MRLKLTFLVALALWSNVLDVQAQNDSIQYSYSISDPLKPVMARKNYYFGWNGSAVVCRNLGATLGLQVLEGEKLNAGKYTLVDDFEKYFAVEQFFQIGDSVYLFYSAWDPEQYKEQLFVRTLLISNASFIDKGRKLLEVPGKVRGGNGNKFHIGLSGDSTLYYVKYRKTIDPRVTDFEEFGAAIYTDELELLRKEEMKMPIPRDQMKVMDYTVNSEGTISFLTRIENGLILSQWDGDELRMVDFDTLLPKKMTISNYVWHDEVNGRQLFIGCKVYANRIKALYYFDINGDASIHSIDRYSLLKVESGVSARELYEFNLAQNEKGVVNASFSLRTEHWPEGKSVGAGNATYWHYRYIFAHIDRSTGEVKMAETPEYWGITDRGFTKSGYVLNTNQAFFTKNNQVYVKGGKNEEFTLLTVLNLQTGTFEEVKLFDPHLINDVKIKEMNLENMFALSETELVIPVYDIRRMERFIKVTIQPAAVQE